ncbi:hypothetical protein RUM44_007316 [Polyplax serrata]|uniref:Uncharacterized protein n=1 Tax=Polyplax serrata TaxID=468196 RepID=A0ABR1B0B3_POLSC
MRLCATGLKGLNRSRSKLNTSLVRDPVISSWVTKKYKLPLSNLEATVSQAGSLTCSGVFGCIRSPAKPFSSESSTKPATSNNPPRDNSISGHQEGDQTKLNGNFLRNDAAGYATRKRTGLTFPVINNESTSMVRSCGRKIKVYAQEIWTLYGPVFEFQVQTYEKKFLLIDT